MTPEELLQRSEAAKRLLDDPLVKETLAIMEKEIIEAFADCPVRDLEGMRMLQSELRRVRKFRGILLGVMESGGIARRQIQERQPLMRRIISAVR